ncbi:MAG: biotin/lipoyl-containing protein [bacterium]|nr:biotin/lipoyl-containing protein [bacterium]
MNHTYEHNGQTHTVTLETLPDGGYRVTINGETRTVQASRTADGGWLLHIDGRRRIVHTAAQGENRYAHVDGQTFALTVPDPRKSARRRGSGSAAGISELNAQMPGKVTAVLAQQGDVVQKGQTLVILEAMKMEIRVSAPSDGTLARLLVEPGQVVERGQLLAELRAGE